MKPNWKYGDKLKLSKEFWSKNWDTPWNKNSIFVFCGKGCYGQEEGRFCYTEPNGDHNGWGYNLFELVEEKQPVKNDIEWLDRIQENERNGY